MSLKLLARIKCDDIVRLQDGPAACTVTAELEVTLKTPGLVEIDRLPEGWIVVDGRGAFYGELRSFCPNHGKDHRY